MSKSIAAPDKMESTTHPTYRADVDGLRAVAVLPVILYHAGLGCPGGYVGVDVFFVISGFLITSLILKEIGQGTFRLVSFWERRIRRILPPLLVVIGTSAVLGWLLLLPPDFKDLWGSIAFQSAMIANIWFWLKSDYFAAPAETQPLLHLWSLAVEEQFYVGLPVMLILLRQRRRSALAGSLGSLALISFGLCVYASYKHPDANYYLLPTRAWELLVGALLVLLPAPRTSRSLASEMVAGLGLGAISIAIFAFDNTTRFPGIMALLPCVGAAAVIWTGSRLPRELQEPSSPSPAGNRRPLVNRILSSPLLRGIGLLSYSLYLWHWPLLVFAKQAHYRALTPIERILVLACSVILALATWRFVETPFRRRLWLPGRRALFSLAGASIAIILGMGLWLVRSDGLPSRFSPRTLEYSLAIHDNNVLYRTTIEDVKNDRLIEIGGGDLADPIHCLVWGDSHAMSIFPAVKALAEIAQKRCVSATHASTAPLLGYASTGPASLKEQSPAFNAEVVRYVTRHKVPHVLMVGYWSAYPLGQVDEITSRPAMHDFIHRTVVELQNVGTRVWIMKQVPAYFPVVIPNALARLSILGQDGDALRIPASRHAEALAPFDMAIDAMSGQGALILDPIDLMTDATQRTLVEADGQVLYRDGHHLTVAGAMRLKPLFEPIFAEPRATQMIGPRRAPTLADGVIDSEKPSPTPDRTVFSR